MTHAGRSALLRRRRNDASPGRMASAVRDGVFISRRTGRSDPPHKKMSYCKYDIFSFRNGTFRFLPCGGFVRPLTRSDKIQHLPQRSVETGEIFLVKKNLMPVENDRTIGDGRLPTFGNRQVIVIAPRRTNIEKIGSATRLHGLRQNMFADLFTLFPRYIRSRKHDPGVI